MINEVTKFSTSMVEDYASSIKKKEELNAEKLAKKILSYIDRRYEKRIKKQMNKDLSERKVKIFLPRFYRYKCNDSKVINTILSKHFEKLGFSISFFKGKMCKCPFDFMCNCEDCYVLIRW